MRKALTSSVSHLPLSPRILTNLEALSPVSRRWCRIALKAHSSLRDPKGLLSPLSRPCHGPILTFCSILFSPFFLYVLIPCVLPKYTFCKIIHSQESASYRSHFAILGHFLKLLSLLLGVSRFAWGHLRAFAWALLPHCSSFACPNGLFLHFKPLVRCHLIEKATVTSLWQNGTPSSLSYFIFHCSLWPTVFLCLPLPVCMFHENILLLLPSVWNIVKTNRYLSKEWRDEWILSAFLL